jgi:hypothetical protein
VQLSRRTIQESTVMKNNSGENVYTMHAKHDSAVLTMPSRSRARSSAMVLTMPSHSEPRSKVVTFPRSSEQERSESGASDSKESDRAPSIPHSTYGALSAGVRMTLVALFALLGWPRPSRDNDPGPSAARPCHWEITNLISQLFLPAAGARSAAAAVNIPARKISMDSKSLLRAA